MGEKIKLEQAKFFELVALLAERIKNSEAYSLDTAPVKIFAVPRGGIPVVYALHRFLMNFNIVAFPHEADFIIDDLIDSGATKERYDKIIEYVGTKGKTIIFDVLIDKRTMSSPYHGEWVVFPWEDMDNDDDEDSSALDIPIRMMQYIGEDVDRDGLLETPERVVRSWDMLYGGYRTNPKELLKTFDNVERYDQMVTLRNIEFYSTCEHHILPFFGRIHIAYLPTTRIVGISKLARVVEAYSRRLQVQERLTQQVAKAVQDALNPLGVGVYCEAQHLCMIARGVQKQNSVMCTTALTGNFLSGTVRDEFFATVQKGR